MTSLECARSIIDSAVSEFGDSLAVLTSFQREGVVIVDLVMAVEPRLPVFTIDTGCLPPETFQIIDAVESRYGIRVERLTPDGNEVAAMVGRHGSELFHDGVPQRMLCCNVRKVRPLAARMKDTAAYFAGIRRAQNDERSEVEDFDRSQTPIRVSPLAGWTSAEVTAYTKEHSLPEHPLYARGYTSIGCAPCTRATVAGDSERAGRWWWETDTAKECGLHFSPDGRVERSVDVFLRELLEKPVAA